MKLGVSERRACKVLRQPRSTQRHESGQSEDRVMMRDYIIKLAEDHRRYGIREIEGLLRNEGKVVNHKRIELIWQQEGLQVPQKPKKRSRVRLSDGSYVRLRAEHPNHVWSYDFVSDKTHDGKKLKLLTIVDEFSKECLGIPVKRKMTSNDVIDALSNLFIIKGMPEYIRSDNGAEFTAKAIIEWLKGLGVAPLFIEPGSPWENCFIESFNGKLRYGLLDCEIFTSLLEAQVLTEQWRQEYNHIRPHSALGYKPPVPKAILPADFEKSLTLEVVQ